MTNKTAGERHEILTCPVALTGLRPTTAGLHLGHLVGNIRTLASIVAPADKFLLLSDQAITRGPNSTELTPDLIHTLSDALAAWPEDQPLTTYSTSHLRSNHLPLLISIMEQVRLGRFLRIPSIKALLSQSKLRPTIADIAYPIIQVTEILAMQAQYVCSNDDNAAFVELAREVARKAPLTPGLHGIMPSLVAPEIGRLPGTDGKKMSVSRGNCVFLTDSDTLITRKVMSLLTDTNRISSSTPGCVENNPLFTYMRAFQSNEAEEIRYEIAYKEGRIGDVEVKRFLSSRLIEVLGPIREKALGLRQAPTKVIENLLLGCTDVDKRLMILRSYT